MTLPSSQLVFLATLPLSSHFLICYLQQKQEISARDLSLLLTGKKGSQRSLLYYTVNHNYRYHNNTCQINYEFSLVYNLFKWDEHARLTKKRTN